MTGRRAAAIVLFALVLFEAQSGAAEPVEKTIGNQTICFLDGRSIRRP
jgi:hypothetical protein